MIVISHGYTLSATRPLPGSVLRRRRRRRGRPRELAVRRTGGSGEHHRAGEVGDECARRRGRELAGGAALDDPAVVDHADLVPSSDASSNSCVTSTTGTSSDRSIEVQLAGGARPGAGVERGQRLVEQERVRARGASARASGDPLALAAGQRCRPGVGAVGETEAVEQRRARSARRSRATASTAARTRRCATRSGGGTGRSPGTRSRTRRCSGGEPDPALGVYPDLARR